MIDPDGWYPDVDRENNQWPSGTPDGRQAPASSPHRAQDRRFGYAVTSYGTASCHSPLSMSIA